METSTRENVPIKCLLGESHASPDSPIPGMWNTRHLRPETDFSRKGAYSGVFGHGVQDAYLGKNILKVSYFF